MKILNSLMLQYFGYVDIFDFMLLSLVRVHVMTFIDLLVKTGNQLKWNMVDNQRNIMYY
jgi:hypothetical protein